MVNYEKGNPKLAGMYACRIRALYRSEKVLNDLFLMWIDQKWFYPSSDSEYKGKVLGWIGPLQRKVE